MFCRIFFVLFYFFAKNAVLSGLAHCGRHFYAFVFYRYFMQLSKQILPVKLQPVVDNNAGLSKICEIDLRLIVSREHIVLEDRRGYAQL